MGFFSRSKKPEQKPTSSPPPARPQTEPATSYTTQAACQPQYGPQPPYNYQNGQERPSTAHGRGQSFPPPQGAPWHMTPPPPYHPYPYQQIFVSNYLLPAPPVPIQPQTTGNGGKKSSGKKCGVDKKKLMLKSASVTNLSLPRILQGDLPSFIPGAHYFNDGSAAWQERLQQSGVIPLQEQFLPLAMAHTGGGYGGGGTALYDLISTKFDAVVSMIDGELFSGDEKDLLVYPRPAFEDQYAGQSQELVATNTRGLEKVKEKSKEKDKPRGAVADTGCLITNAIVGGNYFAKVNLYANSRMQGQLSPVKLYLSTFPLLCLAAQYSSRVYDNPTSRERTSHVPANVRLGTKAMVIKSIPLDSSNVIVFAIRGSQTFLDWTVNFNDAPTQPTNFLDDPGNCCHAGFLSVARKMVKPVAARLRQLLQEDPSRSKCSLLITGHSAGGAVAALLYMHMLSSSREAQSELSIMTDCFRRIHCITFGAPPVSLLALQKPADHRWRKSLFLGLVNEGDPISRADKAYLKSLLELYSRPAPLVPKTDSNSKLKANIGKNEAASKSRLLLTSGRASASTSSLALQKHNAKKLNSKLDSSPPPKPTWSVPDNTLSNAGRLILLRGVPRQNGKKGEVGPTMDDGVQAFGITDDQLRKVVFGDPVCHMMKLYARRMEVLATNAVVGR